LTEEKIHTQETPDFLNPLTKTTKTNFDDFDWNLDKRHIRKYDANERKELENLYDGTFASFEDNDLIKGIIVGMTKTDVIVNIGYKSDGIIPLSEFRDTPDVKIGDEIELYVIQKEDAKGHLNLSRKNAKLMRAWEQIQHAHQTGEVVEGLVTSKTKGGLIVDLFGMETFLPGSQIDVKLITDYDFFVGKRMEFKVVKINEIIKNAVVSHKALIEHDIESQRLDIISKLEKGQVLEGTIKNITDFGAFIDLGGLDGLLYITDISWGRITHPEEVLELNQKLKVVILEYDENKKRISLGLKQLTPHPWEIAGDKYAVGQKVRGKIVNIEDYGAFLEIEPGIEGLIHVSEISWSNQPINSKEFFKPNDEYEAKIVTIEHENKKMSLSLKALTPDPWKNISEKYPLNSKHNGKVKNITAYGVFVELEEGIGGMVHISDLSWTKRYNHPNEFTKVNKSLDVKVLEIDTENRKLSLGCKQIEEDPWDTFESVFPIGSIHKATIIKRDEKGAVLMLPYGLEGFAPAKHLKKEDGKLAILDETLDFQVIEFDRNDKRIILSHSRMVENMKRNEENAQAEEKKKEKSNIKKTIDSLNSNVEKERLGDISDFADLKRKMKDDK